MDTTPVAPAEARARFRSGDRVRTAGWADGFAVIHGLGHMFVTDLADADLRRRH